MEVITIDVKAYKELMDKINTIAKFVLEIQKDYYGDPEEAWVDSYEVCTFLKISDRTLQRLRTEKRISFSIISGKAYAKSSSFLYTLSIIYPALIDNLNLIILKF